MQSRGWIIHRSLIMAALGAILSAPAQSQDLPPAPNPSAAPDAAPAAKSAAETPATATVSGGAGASEIAPGPLEEARKMLWTRIKQAKEEGIGTGAYVAAFKGVEDDVRAGKSEEEIKPRIASLARSLKDQLDRSKILKTQRPIPPSASQSVGGGAGTAPGGGNSLEALAGKLGSKDSGGLVDKLKEKLNSGDIPDGLKEKLLNSDKAKELLKKYGL